MAKQEPKKRGPGRPRTRKAPKSYPAIEKAKKSTKKKKSDTFTVDDIKEGRNADGTFNDGNKIWLLRTKVGRDKLFESPEVLWSAMCEYFQYCNDNPLIEIDYKGKDAKHVKMPRMRAYTWQGLELFLGINSLREYKTNPKYSEFSHVIEWANKVMYSQKFEGAAAGLLNATVISRDLGLRESTHVSIEDDRNAAGDLFPDELKPDEGNDDD